MEKYIEKISELLYHIVRGYCDAVEIYETPGMSDAVTIKIRKDNYNIERCFTMRELCSLREGVLDSFIGETLRLMIRDLNKGESDG